MFKEKKDTNRKTGWILHYGLKLKEESNKNLTDIFFSEFEVVLSKMFPKMNGIP